MHNSKDCTRSTHHIDSTFLLCLLQVWITSTSGATIGAIDPAEPRLFTISHGAPHIHLQHLRLLGTLRIAGGHLTATNCTIEAIGQDAASERALSILGGRVTLLQTTLWFHSSGAIEVFAANLTLIECTISSCTAETGGAMLVGNGADVDVARSLFADNSARSSGGAVQVPNRLETLSSFACVTKAMYDEHQKTLATCPAAYFVSHAG